METGMEMMWMREMGWLGDRVCDTVTDEIGLIMVLQRHEGKST